MPEIRLYRRRFYMLLLFSMCTMMNACGWISFAPISDILTNTYGVSLFMINYMSLIYMISFIPVNFLSVVVLDKWGLRWGITLGMSLTTLGLWLRTLINYSFTYVIIGQTIMAIG